MKCAACDGGLPPGKVLFCPTCFGFLPRKEQGACVSHYVRICKSVGHSVTADHPGMKDKIEKLARMICEARGITAPVASGIVLVEAPRRTDNMRRFRDEIRPGLQPA